MPKQAPNESDTAVHELLVEWLRKGDEFGPNGMAAHPELVFRLTGEWRGWASFVGESAAERDCADQDKPKLSIPDWFDLGRLGR